MKVVMIISMILALSCNKILNEESILLATSNQIETAKFLNDFYSNLNNMQMKFYEIKEKNESINSDLSIANEKINKLNEKLKLLNQSSNQQTLIKEKLENIKTQQSNGIKKVNEEFNKIKQKIDILNESIKNPKNMVIEEFKEFSILKKNFDEILSKPNLLNEMNFDIEFENLLLSYDYSRHTSELDNVSNQVIALDNGYKLIVYPQA